MKKILDMNKKLHFLLIFTGAVILLPLALGSEDLEVRTYYPFPYASYYTITATDYFMFGDYNYNERIKVGNIVQTAPTARTFQGIESNGNLYLQSAYAINIPSNIQLSVAGRNSVLARFCRWVAIKNPQCKNLPDGVRYWQPVMLARRIANGKYRTYYNKPNLNATYNYTKHSGNNGRVLCCRVEDQSRN